MRLFWHRQQKEKAVYTPAKQREWLRALAEDVKRGGGIGVITWGTESLPDLLEGKAQGHGTGLYTYPAAWGYVRQRGRRTIP